MITEAISHYRILRKLGAGGMGEVFLAEDTSLERKVAIKFLLDKSLGDALARKRFIREARVAAGLDHVNICTIYEVNDEGTQPFIVMQYIEGESLATKICNRPLQVLEAVDIAMQMCEALVEAHSHKIIHRDIKPQNVIVTPRGQVKILDFGLAKVLPDMERVETEAETLSQATGAGQVVGTAGYMSPEQLRGEPVDPRTDLFSLGVLIYNCVTGKPAFPGSSTIEICLKVIQSDPPKPSDLNASVPAELESIVARAMKKDVRDRYQSAGEMLTDLLELKAAMHQASQARTRAIMRDHAAPRFKAPASLFAGLRRWPLKVAFLIAPLLLIAAIWITLPLLSGAAHQPTPEARRWYEIGTSAIREGAYYKAATALEEAIAKDHRYALARARLAEAYMEMDYTERAKDEMLAVASLLPDRTALPKTDAGYLDAIAATVSRDTAGAIEHYQRIAEQAPESERSNAYLDLGRAYEKNENIDKAIERYEEAARLDPQSAAAFLRQAILYGRKQEIDKATEAFDKAEAIYRASSNVEGATEVLYQRGAMLSKINKVHDARLQLEAALKNALLLKNKYQQIRAQLQLSTVYIVENTDRARSIAEEAVELAQANNLRSLAGNGIIDLGYTFVFRGEYNEAGKYFKQALGFAQADKARRSEARALLALGTLYVLQTYDDEAIPLLEQALAFYRPSGYRKEASIALTMLGRALRSKGDYEDAIGIFMEQLRLSEELGDSAMVADSHLSLALTLGIEQERYPEALRHIQESSKVHESSGTPMNTGYDEMNRAGLLWQLGRYDEAHRSLERALSIASRPEAGYKVLQAWVHLVYAQMALSKRQLTEAREKGRQALELTGTQYRDVTVQAKYCIGLAQALSGATQAAIKLCGEAVAMAGETKNPRLLSNALLALAEVLLLANRAEQALTTALQAQQVFSRSGRQESEWRALLVAARASQIAGDRPEAAGYLSRAHGVLSSLQAKWDPESFAGYMRRPDIKSYRAQLDHSLRLNK